MIQRDLRLYRSHVSSDRQALLHLLLHCCHKDGECNEKEMEAISDILQQLSGAGPGEVSDAQKEYRSYARFIRDDVAYLRFLLHYIRPADPLALMRLCMQVTTSDRTISLSEELLINNLAHLLHLPPENCRALHWKELKSAG